MNKFFKILLTSVLVHAVVSALQATASFDTLNLYVILSLVIFNSLFSFIPLTTMTTLRLLVFSKIQDHTLRAGATILILTLVGFIGDVPLQTIVSALWLAFYSHYLDVKNGN